jgi:membrane-associated phospholipid phosphatase
MQQMLNEDRIQAPAPHGASGMSGIRSWTLGFLATLLMVAVSYQWLDRPISLFAHEHLRRVDLFEKLTLIPDAMGPVAVVVFLGLALRGLTGRPLSRFQTVTLLSAVSLAVALAIKDQLKIAFSRPWPESWMHYNNSFIRDGLYGFFPFHGADYAAFPSGHMTAICTVMTVFWLCYPRFRALYALCMAAVAIGLVGANFHFLSDMIAGAFLGISAGWLGVALWEMGTHRVRPDDSSRGIRPETAPSGQPDRDATPKTSAEHILLTGADRDAFLEAALKPPEPSDKLITALRRHRDLTG